ncbi:probable cysteine--tRNA ligase, mitochondrial [Aricia agestis]|uniref:probable cysteine--tRNA ligase, mitochondrial n=1 Tax=Aricia agestis TaxID=91739 RepID=UPI001C206A7D|nr:probable cysteine--tRNA ligase, mitochondrial [Aricia agestis]
MRKLFPIFKRNLTHVCRLKPYKDTKWLMPNGNPVGVYVYNCVAQEKVPIILNDPKIATWYSCGPTVYDSAHIGHASCYVKLDIIQRILKSFFDIKLVTAMGITDIDDKIIKKSNDTQTDFRTVAKKFEHEFWVDMAALNVEKPMIITRVSEHIENIKSFVEGLVNTEMAYAADDGSVYFDTSKYSSYGKLQKMQDSGEPSCDSKKNKMDFALWKGSKPGEPSWKTVWGEGRPGWHIECSAMVSKVFGSQLDFHAGGIDLQFPHHENEEAQSCAYHNTTQWANYWIHIGHLILKDTKMSKSLQNTIPIPSLLETYNADTFRMACLMSKYRYSMEYNDEMMKSAEDVFNKFKFFFKDVEVYINSNVERTAEYNDNLLNDLHVVEEKNLDALRQDFNTSSCVNSLLNLIGNANKVMKSESSNFSPVPILLIADYIYNTLTKFGLKFQDSKENISSSLIDVLVDFRHTVRLNAIESKNKDLLKACDLVRDKMKTAKVQINDSKKTPSWVYVK